MVSFHKALAESPGSEVEASSKKRKWEESLPVEFFNNQTEAEKRKSTFHMPSDKRQQYPSLQSGFCKTRINTDTPEDLKNSPAPPSSTQISLDLELNLTFDQSQRSKAVHLKINEKQKDSGDKSHSEGDHREMVATVCMRCHMLVMLRKSSPACPNCKFMHPPDQNPPKFLKRKCGLLC
ncbi:uncharacterized protein LOC129304078 [Prosopis cineraria]|uniref:uncharacterized protein LOC129304078 n=1 Tax=Prosopis cineraria TaxID=364024 RepID=UPI00240EE633|nr:uncharacterized protein LOC129304078 [Prosopis cineraria]